MSSRGDALGAEAAAHLEAVDVGQHHVEDDDVGPLGTGRGEGLTAVGGGSDLEPHVAEGGLEHGAEVLLVIHEEESDAGHGASLAPLPVSSL